MNYLLDTNACIALINGKPAAVRKQFLKATDAGTEILVSSVVSFELWYGIEQNALKEFNTRRLEAFFAGPISPLPFDHADAQAAGSIRARLELSGKPIGAYDLLIAGQAIRHKLTLVTANISEFARIKGLTWQDWAKL